MKYCPSLVFLIGFLSFHWANSFPEGDLIDVLHYRFQLALNDSTNSIAGKAIITILFRKAVQEFELDLINRNSKGEGMQADQVTIGDKPVHFSHQNDRLKITLPSAVVAGQNLQITIDYGGIPQDGLIISKNKFGDRTFFGDNWPNRAHHWLPTVDHPSDKATCEFVITAPEYYSVIGNGKKMEEISIGKNRKTTRWDESAAIPTKVMAIGVARFAIQEVGRVDHIPVESWVYPQNFEAGFSDYAVALRILDYFHSHIGHYSYEKLANVQSKTRYGGMENASNIFYAENTVDGKNNHEGLIAHEIAHQWFGNSATEKDWHHVWLSEGFATYFSHLYTEAASGHDRLVEEMKVDRKQVIEYSRANTGPVIDPSITVLMKLLNTHSYQKGGWVLHMLRHEVGDLHFWEGIRKYYQRYRNDNAMTIDFQRIMEEVSHQDLSQFFNQWLMKGGLPKLSASWKFDPGVGQIIVAVNQIQPAGTFAMPLDIGIQLADGSHEIHTVSVNGKSQEFKFAASARPTSLNLDPDTWLLFEGEIQGN